MAIELDRMGWTNNSQPAINDTSLKKMEENMQKAITELENLINGTVLYENLEGTSTDFILNNNISNYIGKKIKIYGYDSAGREGSTEIYIRSGTVKARIRLADYTDDSGNRLTQETFADLIINENQVKFLSNSYINFAQNTYPYIGGLFSETNNIKIVRVEIAFV